jgi:hypothetical protein
MDFILVEFTTMLRHQKITKRFRKNKGRYTPRRCLGNRFHDEMDKIALFGVSPAYSTF